jgi:hypothetical protein
MSILFIPKDNIEIIREEIGHYFSNIKNMAVPNSYSHVAPAGMKPARIERFSTGAKLVYLFDNMGDLKGYLYYSAR